MVILQLAEWLPEEAAEADVARRDGRAARSSQPEDSMDSGSPQRQDPGVTRAEFMQMMGMMAQIVQALVPPVWAVPVAAPPHPEGSEQHSRAEPQEQGDQQTEQSVPEQPEQPAQPIPQVVLQQLQEGPIERAQKLGITPFEGSADPAEALSWLDTVESIYKYMHLDSTGEARVHHLHAQRPGQALVEDSAGQIWGKHTDHLEASFEKDFRSKYVSDSHMEDRLREFLDLRQQELTIDTYEQQFTYLAQFAKGFLPSERERCRRFEEGLRLHIRDKVTALRLSSFQDLVEAARCVERTSHEHRHIRDEKARGKKRAGTSSAQTTYPGRGDSGQRSVQQRTDSVPQQTYQQKPTQSGGGQSRSQTASSGTATGPLLSQV